MEEAHQSVPQSGQRDSATVAIDLEIGKIYPRLRVTDIAEIPNFGLDESEPLQEQFVLVVT
jgi:hypothetical protein